MLQDQLKACQEHVRQLTIENHRHQESLHAQEVELEQQKTMVNRIRIQGQPSFTSTITNYVNPTFLQEKVDANLWKWENKGTTPKELFQMYKNQRDLFFLASGLSRGVWIDHDRFYNYGDNVGSGVWRIFWQIFWQENISICQICTLLS